MIRRKNIVRVLAGRKAQKSGSGFEEVLIKFMSFRGWYTIRIKNGCKTTSQGLKRVRQDFDFVSLGPNGIDIFFDAKRDQTKKSICLSLFHGESTEHQRKKLALVASRNRRAGFVVGLDAINQVFWVPVTPNGRIAIERAVSWGSMGNLIIRFEPDIGPKHHEV